jgi:hypothetical protein
LSACRPTAPTSTRTKRDQANAGRVGDQPYGLGYIIVAYPGHPLVGRSLPVVRRYREHGERLWVIELPDGTRQYLPAAWCTPLVPSGSTARLGVPPMSEPPPGPPPSPLSLAGLRELAALVRRLRERGESRRGEHDDVAATKPKPAAPSAQPGALGADDQPARRRRATRLGELPRAGASAPDRGARPDRPTPCPGAPEAAAESGAGVRSS